MPPGTGAAPGPPAAIGIVGVGLIGGSVALAARRAWPGVRVIAVDPSGVADRPETRALADVWAADPAAVAACDVVVAATPLGAMPAVFDALAGAGTHALVTDVGSTKRDVAAAAARAGLATFVGGHPMAGGAAGGAAQASAALFDGRPWFVVPGDAPAPWVERLQAFVTALGARPEVITADAHDRLMAWVSHLPQVAAVALLNAVGDAVGGPGLALAGPGLASTTRLAGSPAGIWQDILAANGDYVAEAIEAFAAALAAARGGLGDRGAVADAFERARAWRGALPPAPVATGGE